MTQWNDLKPAQRRFVVVAAAAELTLKIAAAIDITRRPADQIRGSKRAWYGALLINGFGPIGYFLLGRRNPQERSQ